MAVRFAERRRLDLHAEPGARAFAEIRRVNGREDIGQQFPTERPPFAEVGHPAGEVPWVGDKTSAAPLKPGIERERPVDEDLVTAERILRPRVAGDESSNPGSVRRNDSRQTERLQDAASNLVVGSPPGDLLGDEGEHLVIDRNRVS